MGNFLQDLRDQDRALDLALRSADAALAEAEARQRIEDKRIDRDKELAKQLAKSKNPLLPDDHPLAPLFNAMSKRLEAVEGPVSRWRQQKVATQKTVDGMYEVIGKAIVKNVNDALDWTEAGFKKHRAEIDQMKLDIGGVVQTANQASKAAALVSLDVIKQVCAQFVEDGGGSK